MTGRTDGRAPIRSRVAIVDDHSIFRSGLRADLDDAAASSSPRRRTWMRPSRPSLDLAPDVVLLDVHLPGGAGGGGAEVVRRTVAAVSRHPLPRAQRFGCGRGRRRRHPRGRSRLPDQGQLRRPGERRRRGRRGRRRRLLAAPGRLRARRVRRGRGRAGRDDRRARPPLRPRARGHAADRARAHAYKEVAAELFISIKTVETHVSAVLRKLQLSSRHELTAWALERKLL